MQGMHWGADFMLSRAPGASRELSRSLPLLLGEVSVTRVGVATAADLRDMEAADLLEELLVLSSEASDPDLEPRAHLRRVSLEACPGGERRLHVVVQELHDLARLGLARRADLHFIGPVLD